MIDNKKTLQLIIKRFNKSQKDQIKRLYHEDPTFREICQDYFECIQMQDMYTNDPSNVDAPQYKQDYEGLIEALEEKLLAILNGHR